MMASTTNTAKTTQEGSVPPATAAGGEAASAAANDCTSWDCAVAGIVATTALALMLVVQALTTFGDKPASLMLELSCVLCAVLYAWACFISTQLTPEGHRVSGDELCRVLWWIVDAGAVAVIAGWAFGTVAAMLIMYAASLGVTGFFTCCLMGYVLNRNSTDTTSSISHEQDMPATGSGVAQDIFSQKNSNASSSAKGSYQLNAQEYESLDLEAGLRRDKNMIGPRVKPMTSK